MRWLVDFTMNANKNNTTSGKKKYKGSTVVEYVRKMMCRAKEDFEDANHAFFKGVDKDNSWFKGAIDQVL